MNGIIKSSITAVFVFALSTAAYAADDKSSKKEGDWPSFRKADTDNNGAISMEEARVITGLGDTFAQYDKNNDGQLSRSEYESAKKSAQSGGKSERSPGGSSSPGGASSSPSGGGSSGSPSGGDTGSTTR